MRSRDRHELCRRRYCCRRSLPARWDALEVAKQHVVGLHLVGVVSAAAARRRRLPVRWLVHQLVRRLGAALVGHGELPSQHGGRGRDRSRPGPPTARWAPLRSWRCRRRPPTARSRTTAPWPTDEALVLDNQASPGEILEISCQGPREAAPQPPRGGKGGGLHACGAIKNVDAMARRSSRLRRRQF